MFRRAPVIILLIGLCWSNWATAEVSVDYCAKEGTRVLLLIDATTAYDETDKTQIVEAVNEVHRILKGGDRLIVRTITDSYVHSERLFDRCVPYCETSSVIGRYYHCNDGVIRSDTDAGRHELVRSLKARLARFEDLRYSDIIRTLVTAANEEIKDTDHARIIIVSDLIENSDHLSGSQLFNTPTAMLLKTLKREGLIAALPGADVQIAGIGRAGTPERRPLTVRELNKLTEFWNAYFAAAGASVEMGQHLRAPQ